MPWHQLQQLFVELIKDVWLQYGPFSALLLLLILFHTAYTHRLWTGRLKDKDKEIDRLVVERNRLQEVFLQKRLSSKGKEDA
jgi:hypothetical protein